MLSFFLLSLSARENPFFALSGEDMPVTSNENYSLELLKKASITLPSTARVLESVTVKYKNLDGSQTTKTIQLDNAIDWHLPIFISQSYSELPSVTETKAIKPLKTDSKYRKIASFKFISLYSNGKKLKVITKDKMMRNFLLVNPHRIVFDFQRDINIKSKIKTVSQNSIFTKVRIGTHKGYYRIVVELDGYYSYTLQKSNNQYIFNLK